MSRWEMGGNDALFLRATRRPKAHQGQELRAVDLFSGCGGMSLGVAQAARSAKLAFGLRLAMESRPEIRAVYRSNFTPACEYPTGDVCERFSEPIGSRVSSVERATRGEVGAVDLLIGGPPCQGHSNLNNKTRWNDPKNQLYLRMVRAAEVLEPKALLIENVPGVANDRNAVLDTAISRLVRLGYRIDHNSLCVSDIGVPQRRKRHILIAALQGSPSVKDAVVAHAVQSPRTLAWAIRDLHVEAHRETLFDTSSALSPENARRAKWLLEHDEYDLPNRLRPACHRDESHRYKSMYGRLSWTEPAQTITTGYGSPGQGRYLHPEALRTLTPHEAARLQFFPDWFNFGAANNRTVLATCIGNAVPPKLAFVMTLHLLSEALLGSNASQTLAAASYR